MKARPPWTGWSRNASAESRSRAQRRRQRGTALARSIASISLIHRGRWTLPWKWSVAAALKGSAIDKKFYDEHRNKVVEYIAEHDDELIDKYLNGVALSLEEMRKSIRKSTLSLKIVPVLAGSAFKNKGIQPLLDAVVDYLPSPLDVPPVEPTHPTTHA